MASYGEEGGECGVDEELSRDVQSLQAVLAGEGGDSEHTGHESEGGEEGEGGGCATSAVIGLQECLRKNQELQSLLMKQLKRLNSALIDNKAKQARLSFFPRIRKRKALNMWRFNRGFYFKDFKGRSSPITADVRHPKQGGPENFYTREANWRQDREERRLCEGVVRQNTNHRMMEIQMLIERAESNEEAKQLKEKLKEIKQLPPEELIEDTNHVDWDLLAFEQFNGGRSSHDCQLHWENSQRPALNHGSWDKEEDKQLLRLVKSHEFQDWQAIADQLSTNRSAFACLQRYQRSLNPNMFRSGWTDEEDAALREAVVKYGQKNWKAVSTYIGDNRTPQQCLHRWYNSLHPSIKKGRWGKEEDQLLREAVKHFGVGNWSKISQQVPSRTSVQCRERWVNVLDERIKRGPWDEEEETKLRQLCEEYEDSGTIQWSKVAADLGNRTDYQCAKRWRQLSTTSEVVSQYASRVKKRESIMNNFHGRRKQRSTLSAVDLEDDLIPETTKEKLKLYQDKIEQQKLRQAGLIKKKSPFKGDAARSDTVPETEDASPRDSDTTSRPEQQEAASEGQGAQEGEDMEVGVAEATTLRGSHRRKRSSRGRRSRKSQTGAVDECTAVSTVSTESALMDTSQAVPVQPGPQSHTGSEPEPQSVTAHSSSEPGPSNSLQQTASASATVSVTLRASATPPLYTLAPTTTTVTPSAAHHATMYDRAVAYLRSFDSATQPSGSVLPAAIQGCHSGMSIPAPDAGMAGSKDASTTESPITAAVQALLNIHNVPHHPPATCMPSLTSETNDHHHSQAESLDTGTSGGLEHMQSIVPGQQPLCSTTEEIIRDSASNIHVVDTWSGQLALFPLLLQENAPRPRESSTTATSSRYTTASQTPMMQPSQTTLSPFPPRMILSLPIGYNVSSGIPSSTIAMVGPSCLPPYVPFVGPTLLPPSELQSTLIPITETSLVDTGPQPLVAKEAEFLSELNEVFLVLLENPAYKPPEKRRPKRRRVAAVEDGCSKNVGTEAVLSPLCAGDRAGADGESSETNGARELDDNDKSESENMAVSAPHSVSESGEDSANDEAPLPEQPSLSKRPRIESSGVGSALATESMTAFDSQETADNQQATSDAPQEIENTSMASPRGLKRKHHTPEPERSGPIPSPSRNRVPVLH